MSAASDDDVARRVALALEGEDRIWIAPELTAVAAAIPAARRVDDGPSVAILAARQLDNLGAVCALAAPAARRYWAVLSSPIEIVNQCSDPVARVERAFSNLGVIEVMGESLVIVELARGTSAKDLQACAQPTLQISSRVDLMRVV